MIDTLANITLNMIPATASGQAHAGKPGGAKDAVTEAFRIPLSEPSRPRSDSSSVREKSAAPPPERDNGGRLEIERSSAPSPKPTPSARTEDTARDRQADKAEAKDSASTAATAEATPDDAASALAEEAKLQAAPGSVEDILSQTLVQADPAAEASGARCGQDQAACDLQTQTQPAGVAGMPVVMLQQAAAESAQDTGAQQAIAQNPMAQALASGQQAAQNQGKSVEQPEDAHQHRQAVQDSQMLPADTAAHAEGPSANAADTTKSQGASHRDATSAKSHDAAELAGKADAFAQANAREPHLARPASSDASQALSSSPATATAKAANSAAVKPVDMGGQTMAIAAHDGATPVAKAGAASATGETAPMPRSTPTEQVALRLVRQAGEGKDSFSFQLHPAEMGKIDVRLDVASDGKVSARIMADNQATLDMLQRDHRQLERALNDAGLKADPGCLDFSLQQNNRQAQQQTPDQQQSSRATRALREVFAITPDAGSNLSSAQIYSASAQRVDIRI